MESTGDKISQTRKSRSVMNTILFFIFLSAIFCSSCNKDIDKVNYFTSKNDTLIIKTEKIKGVGMFPAGAGEIHFETNNRFIDFPLIVPENISDVKIGFELFDFKPWKYEQYKKGNMDRSSIIEDISKGIIDTLIAPSLKDNSICILSGRKGDEMIFIVDENNNKNFKDDSIRPYQQMDWKTTTNLIKCEYKIYNGKKLATESTWVNIGFPPIDSTLLLFFVSHHLIADFKIDNNSFQIGFVDRQNSFWFDEPLVTVISENAYRKDTILKRDLLKLGEYLKLENYYYCIQDITNDGSYLTLVKENNFSSKIGTQMGMIAPEFKFKSFNGDTLSKETFKNEMFLIANISACTSSSYNEYKNLLTTMKGKLKIVGINYGIRENLGGIMVDIEDKYNLEFYNNYRNAYSSYECLLIDKEGRIIDKFDVFDWKKNLSKIEIKNQKK